MILWELAEAHAQQDPTFRTTVAFTRLTAAEALKQLRARGVAEAQLPSPSSCREADGLSLFLASFSLDRDCVAHA